MTVHVGEVISEVEALPEARAEQHEREDSRRRDARMRLRASMEAVERDAARTRARGYDD